MAKYVFIFRGGGVATPGLSPTEMQGHLNRWHEWIGGLMKAGHTRGGQSLDNGGKLIRGVDRVVTDGPYAESKDLVTGNMIIEAASLDEATELARGCPVFEYDGSLEVRPLLGEGDGADGHG